MVRTIQGPPPQGCTQELEFHPYGDYLASATGTQLKLWDTRRKECIKVSNFVLYLSNFQLFFRLTSGILHRSVFVDSVPMASGLSQATLEAR